MDEFDWGTSSDNEYGSDYSTGSNYTGSSEDEDWMNSINSGSGYSSGWGDNMWDTSKESLGNYDPNWGQDSSSPPLTGNESSYTGGWNNPWDKITGSQPTQGGGFADAFKNLQQQPMGGLKEAINFGAGSQGGGAFSPNTSVPGMSMQNTTGDPRVNPMQSGGGQGWDLSGFLNGLFGRNGQQSGTTQQAGPRGGILETLFGGQQGNSGQQGADMNSLIRNILPFFAANEEKKSADNYEKQAAEQLAGERKYLDPFAGERRQYMDLLKGASGRMEDIYNNPNSSSMYTTARSEMERRIPRQFAKDHNRFGMGVNRAMSTGAADLQAKALTDARDTFKSYLQPSGANINPNSSSAIITALLQAQKQANTNPMFSAAGKAMGGDSSQQNAVMDWLKKQVGG